MQWFKLVRVLSVYWKTKKKDVNEEPKLKAWRHFILNLDMKIDAALKSSLDLGALLLLS